MGRASIGEGIALWDIQNKKRVSFLSLAYPSEAEVRQPIWSPDGQKFVIGAILENHRTLDLYAVNRKGEIQQLTYFEDLIKRQE
jgi:Tol biopolymer transport system component